MEEHNSFGEWLDNELNNGPRGKIKQVQLAKLFGVNPSTISSWIIGRSMPEDEQIDKLVTYFGQDKTFFLRLMGKLDSGHAYTPEVAAMMQYVDQRLAEIDDPKIKEVVLERLKRDLAALTDTVERLADLFGDKE